MKSIDYEKHLVKLSFDYKEEDKLITHYGSGVVVLPTEYSEYLYIFTAKHTFEKELENEDYPDEKTKYLFNDEYIKKNLRMELLRFHCDEGDTTSELYPSYINNITKIIQLKGLDLLIFELCIKDIDIDVCPLSISKSNFDEVVVAGFPSIRNEIPYGYISNFNRDYDRSHFEIKSQESLSTHDTDEYNAIKGISGGGVFIEKNHQVYLVGIEIEYESPKSFKCINLQTIYPKINSILKSRTDTISIPIDLNNGKSFDIDMVKINLKNKNIYLAIYPVTFEEYDIFCNENTSIKKVPDNGMGRERKPVINISWNNAIQYCTWLSSSKNEYRLLTLDEWKSISKMIDIEKKDICYDRGETFEVDDNIADNLGLYHFYGNVNEWCYDLQNNMAIAVGGSYINKNIESRRPIKKLPSKSSDFIGFRIVKELI